MFTREGCRRDDNLDCIRETLGSSLGHGTGYPECVRGIAPSPGHCLDQTGTGAGNASLHILHDPIRRCTAWDTEEADLSHGTPFYVSSGTRIHSDRHGWPARSSPAAVAGAEHSLKVRRGRRPAAKRWLALLPCCYLRVRNLDTKAGVCVFRRP